MTERPDPIVTDALRRLEVPEHGEGFWDELDARLAATTPGTEDHPRAVVATDDPLDGSDPDVVDLRARRAVTGRRRSIRSWQLVAAVAAVVALVVGVSVLRPVSDDGSLVGVAGQGQEDRTQPDPPAPDPAPARSASEVADAWLDAVAAGDAEAAYRLLEPGSREEFGFEGFADVVPALAEGAGAFAQDGVRSSSFTVHRPEGRVATVVVYSGEVEREGMVETAAFPVVVLGTDEDPASGGVAFRLDALIEPVPATPGSTLSSPLEVSVSPQAAAWVSVDGSAPQQVPVRDVGSDQVRIDVEAIAGAGTHVVTLFAIAGDAYTARSVTVVVP